MRRFDPWPVVYRNLCDLLEAYEDRASNGMKRSTVLSFAGVSFRIARLAGLDDLWGTYAKVKVTRNRLTIGQKKIDEVRENFPDSCPMLIPMAVHNIDGLAHVCRRLEISTASHFFENLRSRSGVLYLVGRNGDVCKFVHGSYELVGEEDGIFFHNLSRLS